MQNRFNLEFARAYFPLIQKEAQNVRELDYSKPFLVMPAAGRSEDFNDIYYYHLNGKESFIWSRYLLSGLNSRTLSYHSRYHGIYPAIMLLNWKVQQLGLELIWAYHYPDDVGKSEKQRQMNVGLRTVGKMRTYDFPGFEPGIHVTKKHEKVVSLLMLYVVKPSSVMKSRFKHQTIVYEDKASLQYWLAEDS